MLGAIRDRLYAPCRRNVGDSPSNPLGMLSLELSEPRIEVVAETVPNRVHGELAGIPEAVVPWLNGRREDFLPDLVEMVESAIGPIPHVYYCGQ